MRLRVSVRKKDFRAVRDLKDKLLAVIAEATSPLFLRLLAEMALRHLQRGIERQSFRLAPLTQAYLRRKVREGYDRRILIRTGFYLSSLRVRQTGERAYTVEVPQGLKHPSSGFKVEDIAEYLEYGTFHMPARPHWRPTEVYLMSVLPTTYLRRMVGLVRRLG